MRFFFLLTCERAGWKACVDASDNEIGSVYGSGTSFDWATEGDALVGVFQADWLNVDGVEEAEECGDGILCG